MEINLSKGIQLPTLPGAKGSDFPVAKQTTQQQSQSEISNPGSDVKAEAVEQRRYERVVKAAESFFKDVYAVSDMRFTIYKDTSGQYITRYTSLRDGKVTYIPEPSLLQYARSRSQSAESLIALDV